MKKSYICHLGFAALFFSLVIFFSAPVAAETGYVSDMLLLTLRNGPGDEFPVLRTLPSNTSVEIVEKGERYLKVRLEDGDVGWVQKQYITYDLPGPMVIAQMKKRVEELEAINTKHVEDRSPLVESMETMKTRYEERISKLEADLEKEIKGKIKLVSDLDQAKKKYTRFLNDSKDTAGLIAKNRVMEEENARLSTEISEFQNHKDNLLMTSMMKWFLAGAGVLIAGWIIGRSVGGGKKSSRLLS